MLLHFIGSIISLHVFGNATEFKTGDIVFRQENTWLSTVFSSMENSRYAHAGIIWKKGSRVYVVHLEIADGADGLRVQKWNDFLKNAKEWKLVRLKRPISYHLFEPAIQKYIRIKPKFNLSFSKGTEDKMYCTEFVQAVYKESLGIDIVFTRTKYRGEEFIATKDIYSNPIFIEIATDIK